MFLSCSIIVHMKKLTSIALALLCTGNLMAAKAEDRQGYALDKLANAQAQLDRLKSQERALKSLIKAVKRDLRAARIRAKAERIQLSADTQRQDAAVLVEQSGVAIDLPNLMNTRGVEANIAETSKEYQYDENKDDIDRMFKNNSEKAVYFPGKNEGNKVEPSKSDSDLPDYIK